MYSVRTGGTRTRLFAKSLITRKTEADPKSILQSRRRGGGDLTTATACTYCQWLIEAEVEVEVATFVRVIRSLNMRLGFLITANVPLVGIQGVQGGRTVQRLPVFLFIVRGRGGGGEVDARKPDSPVQGSTR